MILHPLLILTPASGNLKIAALVAGLFFTFFNESNACVSDTSSLSTRITHLNALLSAASEMPWGDERSAGLNEEITGTLVLILSDPELDENVLDTCFHSFLDISAPEDKKFRIFSWYENNGGTWHAYAHVIFYRPGIPLVYVGEITEGLPPQAMAMAIQSELCANGGELGHIHRLDSPEGDRYLLMGSVRSCTTCCFYTAAVIELTPDGINFHYPAFEEEEMEATSCFSRDTRCGSMEEFGFYPYKGILKYSYIPDDLTPVKGKKDPVEGAFRWNGRQFVRIISEE